jgi:hypothetical protein
MTREDVIRMARRAGAVFPGDGSYHTFERIEELEHFAALVAAAERNACAEIVEDEIKRVKPTYSPTADIIRRRIRERGQA